MTSSAEVIKGVKLKLTQQQDLSGCFFFVFFFFTQSWFHYNIMNELMHTSTAENSGKRRDGKLFTSVVPGA